MARFKSNAQRKAVMAKMGNNRPSGASASSLVGPENAWSPPNLQKQEDYEKKVYAGLNEYGEKVYIEIKIQNKNPKFEKKTVDLKETNKYRTLSIVGHTKDSGGQITDEFEKSTGGKLTPEERKELTEIWRRWHLNDLNAGTTKQEQFLKKKRGDSADYDRDVELLKKENLYIDRGYEYGSAWLVEPLPTDVEKRIIEITQKK